MSTADSTKKPRGKPFPKGRSGNPRGRERGSKNKPKTMSGTKAVAAMEMVDQGVAPATVARILDVSPVAVAAAVEMSRALLKAHAPEFAEHWRRASEVAAEDGDHKPAMAALQSIEAVKPIAQTYDTGGKANAVAGVKVELHGFTFAGLPQPAQPEPVTVDVTARSGT